MLTLQQINNLREAAEQARYCEITSKIPCELVVAQWALESGWGQHQPGNNCFGIKEYPGCYGTQLLQTREYFTPQELRNWLGAKPGRTAVSESINVDRLGRARYLCDDYFAKFAALFNCFMKRAQIFNSAKYVAIINKYNQDNNFTALVLGISPIYATDPDYGNKVLEIASIPEVIAAIKEARSANK